MFYSFHNCGGLLNRGGFPMWLVIQADDIAEVNTKLQALVGEKNVSTPGNLSRFDPIPNWVRGYETPHLATVDISDGKFRGSNIHDYRVVYSDGTVVNGKV